MPEFGKFLKNLDFQLEPVYAKQTRPSNSVRSDQDEAEIQYDRLSTQECCNCEKSDKMPTSLECVCCHEIPAVKAFFKKFKAIPSWNTAVLEFFYVEFNCVGNHFLEMFFSEISEKSFLSLSFNVFKMTPFQVFRS